MTQKFDHHTSNSLFVGYIAKTKNVYFIDDKTHNIKMGTHVLFNETHFTVDLKRAPIAAQSLHRLGYANFDNEYKDVVFIPDAIL